MQVTITRTRMAMSGNPSYTYAVLVPSSEVDTTGIGYFIIEHGIEHVTFTDATIGAAHRARPRGIERYQAYLDHEKRCKAIELELARRVYPELAGVNDLWCSLPGFDASHDRRTVEV